MADKVNGNKYEGETKATIKYPRLKPTSAEYLRVFSCGWKREERARTAKDIMAGIGIHEMQLLDADHNLLAVLPYTHLDGIRIQGLDVNPGFDLGPTITETETEQHIEFIGLWVEVVYLISGEDDEGHWVFKDGKEVDGPIGWDITGSEIKDQIERIITDADNLED